MCLNDVRMIDEAARAASVSYIRSRLIEGWFPFREIFTWFVCLFDLKCRRDPSRELVNFAQLFVANKHALWRPRVGRMLDACFGGSLR